MITRRPTSKSASRAHQTLSFMRLATKAERGAGAAPILYWSVEPTGSYSADVERGKAIAEELMEFLLAYPTNGNMTLLSMILVDMTRFGRPHDRGLMVGFGSVIGKFAFIGATVAGSDAIRRDDENKRRALAADLRANSDDDLAEAFETGRLA